VRLLFAAPTPYFGEITTVEDGHVTDAPSVREMEELFTSAEQTLEQAKTLATRSKSISDDQCFENPKLLLY